MEGNVGIGTPLPQARLDVAGGVRIGDDSDACTAAKTGTMRYRSGAIQHCDGSNWKSLVGGVFGGMYSQNQVYLNTSCTADNPLTGGKSCPPGFTAYRIYSNWYGEAGCGEDMIDLFICLP